MLPQCRPEPPGATATATVRFGFFAPEKSFIPKPMWKSVAPCLDVGRRRGLNAEVDLSLSNTSGDEIPPGWMLPPAVRLTLEALQVALSPSCGPTW